MLAVFRKLDNNKPNMSDPSTFEVGPGANSKITIHDPVNDTWQDADTYFIQGPDGSVGLDKGGLRCLANMATDQGVVWIRPGVFEESEVLEKGPAPVIDLGLEFGPETLPDTDEPRLEFFGGRLVLDEVENKLFLDGERVQIQPRMSGILSVLMSRHDTIVTHQTLRDEAWGGKQVSSRTIASFISRCRALFGTDGQRLILSCRNGGYMFNTESVVNTTGPDKS